MQKICNCKKSPLISDHNNKQWRMRDIYKCKKSPLITSTLNAVSSHFVWIFLFKILINSEVVNYGVLLTSIIYQNDTNFSFLTCNIHKKYIYLVKPRKAESNSQCARDNVPLLSEEVQLSRERIHNHICPSKFTTGNNFKIIINK